jgi:hypothetical protein
VASVSTEWNWATSRPPASSFSLWHSPQVSWKSDPVTALNAASLGGAETGAAEAARVAAVAVAVGAAAGRRVVVRAVGSAGVAGRGFAGAFLAAGAGAGACAEDRISTAPTSTVAAIPTTTL